MRKALIVITVALLLIPIAATAQNNPPVADAGEDQTVFLGDVAYLHGTAQDPDGHEIVGWEWEVISAPAGSSYSLSGELTADADLGTDRLGDYVITLRAWDGIEWSELDATLVTFVENQPPTAVAAAWPLSGPAPLNVGFDGTGSSDPEGETLRYLWYFGDSDFGSGATTTHTYDSPGTYIADLTVVDPWGQADFDIIQITVCGDGINCPPVADAGEGQIIFVDQLTGLEGTATDPDDDPIIDWLWAVESSPNSSNPIIYEPWTPDSPFSADVVGDYVLSLIANDGTNWSVPDTVIIEVVEILPPVAVAEADVTSGPVPLRINFDGSQSYDPQGGQLNYGWSFGDGSPGSTEVSPTHEYILPGTYTAQLTVVDSRGQSDIDLIEINVEEAAPADEGDLDRDDDVDRDDVMIILSHRNQPAQVAPACDLDKDGTITVLDARKCVLLCTCPRCVCNGPL